MAIPCRASCLSLGNPAFRDGSGFLDGFRHPNYAGISVCLDNAHEAQEAKFVTKVHVTDTTGIGARCKRWAAEHLPKGAALTPMDECEIFFSVFYKELLPEEFIASRRKCFNFHGGILPQYRGSGTFNWAILNGEKETGITLHEIDNRIDHGPVIEIQKFPIEPTDSTADLFVKAEATIFEMFKDNFARLVALDYTAAPQDEKRAKLYRRQDLQNARDLTRFARAFHTPPYEQAYYYNKKGEKKYIEWE